MTNLLKPKEVAGILKVSPMQVYRLVKQGKIGCYKINSAVRISEDDLNEYLDSRRMKPLNRSRKTRTTDL